MFYDASVSYPKIEIKSYVNIVKKSNYTIDERYQRRQHSSQDTSETYLKGTPSLSRKSNNFRARKTEAVENRVSVEVER
jgi:hypothetical protein